MSGKPTIPEATLRRIRKMAARGHSKRGIAEEIGCSLYTVRKALEGADFIARERERWRRADQQRAPERAADQAYKEYQAMYGATPARREQIRLQMAELRRRRRENTENEDQK